MSDLSKVVNRAAGQVLFNASNYPKAAQSHILGQDMGELREKVTQAVVSAVALEVEAWRSKWWESISFYASHELAEMIGTSPPKLSVNEILEELNKIDQKRKERE